MADTNTVRTLTVRQIQDASRYVAGAKEFVAANKDMASSSSIVGAVVSQTQAKISNAADAVSRQVGKYDQASASAIRFNNELSVLNKSLEGGKISAEGAGRVYAGMIKSFGIAADGADLAAQGFIKLGNIVGATNAEILEFAQTSRAIEEASLEIETMSSRAAALKAQIDPLAVSQSRLNKEVAEYNNLLTQGYLNLEQFTKLELQAKQRHDDLVASLNRTPANDNLLGHGAANFQATNLAFQLQDVATTAAFMPWYTVALQQGPQAAMALQGMEKPVQGLLSAFTQMVNPVSLVTIGIIGAGAAAIHYFTSGETAAKTFDEALKKHRETLEGIKAVYGSLSTDTVTKFSIGGRSLVDASAQSDLASLKKELQVQQKAVLAQMAPTQGFGQLQVLTGNYTAFSDAVTDFMGQVARGNPDLETFDQNVDNILQKIINTPGANASVFADTADDLKGMAEQAVAVKGEFEAFSGPINKFKSDIANGRDGFADFVRDVSAIGRSKGIQDKSAELIGFGEKLLQINAYLVDLKKKMDDAFNDVGPNGFLLSQGTTNQADMAKRNADLQARQVQMDRAEQAYRAQIAQLMARTPVEKQNAAQLAAAAQYNDSESDAERKQRIELAGTQALIAAEHDLRLAKDDRVRASQAAIEQAQYELSLTGKSVEERNRLMAAYQAEAQIKEAAARAGVAADETEIASARKKAAAVADANAQIALGKLVENQGYDAQRLQKEADLIGATADARARAMAELEAEIQLKQQGIGTSSALAQSYIKEQEALAQSRLVVDRQNAAYQSLQQAEGDAIDTMVTGSGSIKDVLNNAKQWLLQMAVANPLKNAFTNTNLPTITDLFSGKPTVPGASSASTAMMNVTATTVMINGSPVGGLPGVPGASGLAGVLGYNPAASTATSPSSLIGAAANQNNTLASVIANAGTTRTGIPLSTIGINGQTAQVNSQYAGNFQGFLNEMQARGYDVSSLGGYNYRNIAGTNTLSNHAFGDAIDINPTLNPVTTRGQPMVTNMPSDVSSIASRYGLEWGGDWNSKKDPMHFEVAKGAQPLNVDQANASLSKLSSTTTSTTKDLGGLGDTTNTVGKTLTDTLGASSSLTKAVPAQLPSNYFPPAPTATPTSGFNPFSLFTSIFSLFGFADGTDYSPGGTFLVGERGKELVTLPRGSRVTPNHKMVATPSQPQKVSHFHEWNVTVSGNGDKELMGRMQTAANQSVAAAMSHYDANVLPSRVQDIQQNPRMVG